MEPGMFKGVDVVLYSLVITTVVVAMTIGYLIGKFL